MSAKHTFAIAPDVKDVLDRCTISTTTLVLPPQQLDRKLYDDVNKVLAAHGGVWKRGKKHHEFPVGGIAKLMAAMGTGEVIREKVVRQAFYTPDAIADQLVEFAGFPQDASVITVLEPSCGDGAIIRAVFRAYTPAHVEGYDIDCATVQAAKRGHSVENRERLLLEIGDFLKVSSARPTLYGIRPIDFCLMNPPYQRGQAKKHIEHAFKFLQRGGVLVAIVPANFDVLALDVEIPTNGCASRDIPAGAFKESGTMIATKMIRLVKA